MKIDDGGAAFARPGYYPSDPSDRLEPRERQEIATDPQPGMSVRTYAAVKAMAAIIGKLPLLGNDSGPDPLLGLPDDSEIMHETYRRVAAGAVGYADALIARLKTPAHEEAAETARQKASAAARSEAQQRAEYERLKRKFEEPK